jgi:tetratricopeptide (TPR) repeat protein
VSEKDFDDRVLGAATGVDAPPPPPSPELLRAVGGITPVRTRGRFGLLMAFAALTAAVPVFSLIGNGHFRRDLGALPVAWLIAAAALWGLAAALSLVAALVPRRGDVLPAPSRASRVATFAMAAVALFALFATVHVPGLSMSPAERGWTPLHAALHCLLIVMVVALPPSFAAATVLPRLMPVGRARVGMALGAAGGAVGGLLLVFICPFASTAHVLLGHVGGMLLAALASAIMVPMFGRRRRHSIGAVALLLAAALGLTGGCAGPSAAGNAAGATTPGPTAAGAPGTSTGGLLYGKPDGSDGDALMQAVAEMDAGKLDASIAELEALHRKHPRNGTVLHELALAYRLSRRPRRAVELLLPYRADLPPPMLSALGSALDEAGDSAQAEAVLREGLKRNPKSGVLYSDLGTTLRAAGRLEAALDSYLQGTVAEPTFPGNYKRAAELYARSDQRALALVYGEMYRLLEPESSAKAAEVMVAVYRAAVTPPGKGKNAAWTVSLAPRATVVEVGPGGKLKTALVPLPLAIELAIGPALIDAHKKGLSLASLHDARKELVAEMAQPDGPFKDHKAPLLPWLVALDAAGHLRAYDYWLYGPAFPDEMQAWGKAHKLEIEAMTTWAQGHPLFWK